LGSPSIGALYLVTVVDERYLVMVRAFFSTDEGRAIAALRARNEAVLQAVAASLIVDVEPGHAH
jgi:hypothetical protein